MEIREAIIQRKSIRRYQNKEVSDALIKDLMEAGRLAPSAYNAQPWRFLVIKDKKQIEELKENKILRQDFTYEAPVMVFCFGDPEVFPKERFESIYSGAREIGGEVGAVRDVSIATQNMVLRAEELGLGTCYIGLVDRDKAKEMLNVSKRYVLPFVITLGYSDEKPNPTPRKTLKEILLN